MLSYSFCIGRKWLREGPTPVTWDNLIQVLRDCGLQTLADYVQDTHRHLVTLYHPLASFPGLPAKRSLYAASSLRMQTVLCAWSETSREVDVG